jgi:lauroyl/myristoyl acyltransferase
LAQRGVAEVLELQGEARNEIVRTGFLAFWNDFFSHLPVPQEWELIKQSSLVGEEFLQEALKRGRGVILWESNSFGARNAAKQVLHTKGYKLTQIHGRNHLASLINEGPHSSWMRAHLFYPFFEQCERRWIEDIILVHDEGSLAFTRQMMRSLSRGDILISAGDGVVGQRKVEVSMFGLPLELPTGMTSLLKVSGACLLPIVATPRVSGSYVVTIGKPIQPGVSEDRDEQARVALQTFVDWLECRIKEAPDQYFGWHLVGRRLQDYFNHRATEDTAR